MKRLAALALLLASCGADTLATEPSVSLIEPPVPPTVTTTTVPVLVGNVDTPAVRMEAEQVTPTQPPPTTALFDPVTFVNALPYDYVDGKDTAMLAFRIVASANGWSDSKIQSWLPFANDLIGKESGYCPNLRRGAIVSSIGCNLIKQGYGEDAGFGQLTSVHHGRNQWLCRDRGVCGANAVISSPWISMSSVIWLLDREGSKPWCYSDWARGFHKCGLAPDR